MVSKQLRARSKAWEGIQAAGESSDRAWCRETEKGETWHVLYVQEGGRSVPPKGY